MTKNIQPSTHGLESKAKPYQSSKRLVLGFNGKGILGSIWDKETRESEAVVVWDEGIENEPISFSV